MATSRMSPHTSDNISSGGSWPPRASPLPKIDILACPPAGSVRGARRQLKGSSPSKFPIRRASFPHHWSWVCSPTMANAHIYDEDAFHECASLSAEGMDELTAVQLFYRQEPSSGFSERLSEAFSNGTLFPYVWSLVSEPLSMDEESSVMRTEAFVKPPFQPVEFLLPLGPYPATTRQRRSKRRPRRSMGRQNVVNVVADHMHIEVLRALLVCFSFSNL